MFAHGQAAGEGNGGAGLSRDRGTLLTGAILILIAAVAWVAVIAQSAAMSGGAMSEPGAEMAMSDAPVMADAAMMSDHSGMSGEGSLAGAQTGWSPVAGLTFLTGWGVMMAAMMLPSATPMIALYGAIRRNSGQTGHRGIPTALFALVYLLLWLAFGAPVYVMGLLIGTWAAASPVVATVLPYVLALTVIAAGAYQFTPLKRACLRVCQTPLAFLLGRWRSGYSGTLRLALDHAAYCLGCCWALMIVLVAAGAMAFQWVLLIAVVVFAEKILPRGEWTARIVGALLIALGLLIAIRPDLAATLQSQGM